MEKIKIAIVDDQPIICDGLEKILNNYDEFSTIMKATSGKMFLELLENSNDFPDLILLDIDMPEMNGIDTLKKLIEIYPESKIVMISYHTEPQVIYEVYDLGAKGYIQKNWSSGEVIDNIRKASENEFYFNNEINEILFNRQNIEKKNDEEQNSANGQFSKRELEVLDLLCKGMTSKEISDALFINIKTVESHRFSLFKKANVSNSPSLILYAINNGLFIPNQND